MTPDIRIRVLSADPPWTFGDKLPGEGRGAAKHYPTLKLAEIFRYPLPPLADDALLALWRVGAMVEEAYQVIHAWGFTPKSEIVWVKTGRGTPSFVIDEDDLRVAEASTAVTMGMGHFVRNAHEVAIIATRGRYLVSDRSVRSVLFAPIGEHSEKPDLFYTLLERLGGAGPFAELFGRKPRIGWHVYGNEVPDGYVWTPPPLRCLGPHGSHRFGPKTLADGTRLCDDCGAPEHRMSLEAALRESIWAEAQRHALATPDEDDLSEIVLLPRHKVRRDDGRVVSACCIECRLPQYASPTGVICTRGHEAVASIPGCEFCGLADGHPLECEALGLPTEPPPPHLAVAGMGAEIAAALAPPPVPVLEQPTALEPLVEVAGEPWKESDDTITVATGELVTPAPPSNAPPNAQQTSDTKRAVLVERAMREGMLNDEDLAEGLQAAWIKLQYRAPAGWFPQAHWFEEKNGAPSKQPGDENLSLLASELGVRGIHVALTDLAGWTTIRRDIAREWVKQGGPAPEWLANYGRNPPHDAACGKGGCIGADAGCPAARQAWARLPPTRAVDGPRAPQLALAAPKPPAPPAEAPAKRGRGRPPGAKNKPKGGDRWATARSSLAEGADPEVEEGFFS